jgi:hypothetical protein
MKEISTSCLVPKLAGNRGSMFSVNGFYTLTQNIALNPVYFNCRKFFNKLSNAIIVAGE